MSKMFIMKGLPASGKSTRAKEIMAEYGNVVRLNKDLIRTMLHFEKFNGRNEGLTNDAVKTLAKLFLNKTLNKGTSVIIDDTNLNPGTMESWKALAKEVGASTEVVEMDTPVEVCVLRDTQREKSVGGTVIKNMAMRYGKKIFLPDSVVLCDIDGTIADTGHRLHHVQASLHADGKKDWKAFFSEMHKDPVREDVRKILIQHYNEGKTVIFLSARPDDYKEVTLKWLAENNLSFAYTLIMRQSGDRRPDTETKRDMLNAYFPDKGVIHSIIDDRPAIIRLWKEMGIANVIDVGEGVEF